MTDVPLVSVVVCSFDRGPTLGPALESVACQDTGGQFSFEIVVIDDGSTEETERIVRHVAAGSRAPVHYVRESGRGVPFARNRGVDEAAGGWIAFFDDDQLAEANWLSELMRAARQANAEIVGGARRLEFPDGEPPDLGPLAREILGEKYYGPRICRSNRYTLACTGNALIRRDVFENIGRFDTGMSRGMSDIDLMRRALDAGVSSWYSPAAAVRHLVPAHRLGQDYLRWTCLRVGTNLSYINHKAWGPARMLFPCLLRVAHAATVNPLAALAAGVTGNRAARLERKCYRWIAAGSARMAAHLLLPGVFVQDGFLGDLTFRLRR